MSTAYPALPKPTCSKYIVAAGCIIVLTMPGLTSEWAGTAMALELPAEGRHYRIDIPMTT